MNNKTLLLFGFIVSTIVAHADTEIEGIGGTGQNPGEDGFGGTGAKESQRPDNLQRPELLDRPELQRPELNEITRPEDLGAEAGDMIPDSGQTPEKPEIAD